MGKCLLLMLDQRVALALEETAPHTYREHIKLIGDMMTYSGDANGFTFSGFRDMIKSAHISAPFTEAAYQVKSSGNINYDGVT